MIATLLLLSMLFQHENQSYLPLSRSELSNRFPVRYIGTIVVPAPRRRPFAPDLSNKEPYFRGRLVSYRWADVNRSEDIELVVETENGRKITSKPVSTFSIGPSSIRIAPDTFVTGQRHSMSSCARVKSQTAFFPLPTACGIRGRL